SLTLANLTVSHFQTRGGDGSLGGGPSWNPSGSAGGAAAPGGVVFNEGTLKLLNDTFTDNQAVGGNGSDGHTSDDLNGDEPIVGTISLTPGNNVQRGTLLATVPPPIVATISYT